MSRKSSSVARLYTPTSLSAGVDVNLSKEQAHYIGRVLRLKPDDEIRLFNADDGEWLGLVAKIGRKDATVRLVNALETASESALAVHLVQGISRGERMDFVVQKATELGVHRITPVLTDHGTVRLDDDRLRKRQAHWQSVADSACEQCGRIRPPTIEPPQPLNDWFGANLEVDGLRLVLVPGASKTIGSYDSEPPTSVTILIGPEGGLSEREIGDAAATGFEPLKLGPRVLRTETAALSAITAVQLRWGDLNS